MQTIIIAGGTKDSRFDEAVKIAENLVGSLSANPDYKLVQTEEGKRNISIDAVRELISELSLRPTRSPNKVAILKDSQFLSVDAQNSLLKILEEPPEYAQIILTVDHANNLIDTILSRCIIRNLSSVNKIDLESDAYKNDAKEIINLIGMDLGKRIDWVTNSKSKFKERSEIIDMLNAWESVLRDLMNLSVSKKFKPLNSKEDLLLLANKNSSAEWKEKIEYLQYVRSAVAVHNANVSLAVESLLANI